MNETFTEKQTLRKLGTNRLTFKEIIEMYFRQEISPNMY